MLTPMRQTSTSPPVGFFSFTETAVTLSRCRVSPRCTVISDGGPHRSPDRREDDAEHHDGQDEVHPRPREHDQEASPQGLQREGFRRIVDRRAASLERILLADHLDVAAHRNGGQTIFGFRPAPAGQDGTEADGKALDPDARPARDEEVAKFVDEDQDPDDDDERRERGDRAHAGRPDRFSIAPCTNRRVAASVATQNSIDPSPPPGARSSASSMSSAMAVKPVRRSSHSPTATSFAALSTTGAAAPLSSAARARRRHGNLSGSGA